MNDLLAVVIITFWFTLLAFLMFDNGASELIWTSFIGLALVQITL